VETALDGRSDQVVEQLNHVEERPVTVAGVRVGIGTRLSCDGEVMVVELVCTAGGTELVVRGRAGTGYRRLALGELLVAGRARVIPDAEGPARGDADAVAAVVLSALSETGLAEVRARAGHVREVLTGYRSGSALLPAPGEPRPDYVSEHLTSVCQRMGISIQPARLRTGRDKPRAAYCTSSG
jgi:hypothetical protein